MTMRYRAALFDFGGTLYSYQPFRERFDALLLDLAARHGVAGDGDLRTLRRIYAQGMAEAMTECGARSSYRHRQLFADSALSYLRRLGAQPKTGLGDYFYTEQTALARELIRPREGAEQVLRALREAGLHIGIVSNIDDDQFEALWQPCGLGPLVDAVTTSEQADSCKPDARIYRVALAKAGRSAGEAFFVGDSFHQDVVGARAMGMTTVLITEREADPEHAAQCDHVIGDLRELLPILGL